MKLFTALVTTLVTTFSAMAMATSGEFRCWQSTTPNNFQFTVVGTYKSEVNPNLKLRPGALLMNVRITTNKPRISMPNSYTTKAYGVYKPESKTIVLGTAEAHEAEYQGLQVFQVDLTGQYNKSYFYYAGTRVNLTCFEKQIF